MHGVCCLNQFKFSVCWKLLSLLISEPNFCLGKLHKPEKKEEKRWREQGKTKGKEQEREKEKEIVCIYEKRGAGRERERDTHREREIAGVQVLYD